jgi:hypothetical protein
MQEAKLREVFSKNRAEELGYDLWNHFVVPPFFEKLNIYSSKKPNVFMGGRGCGKTMLLRYLCHDSTFSSKRKIINSDSLLHIGLYWRIDTQFASLMKKRGLEEDEWQSAFNHLVALQLGIEILDSLKSIALNQSTEIEMADIEKIDFKKLTAYNINYLVGYAALRESLDLSMLKFESWLNNVRSIPKPYFFPGKQFLLALISVIKNQITRLNKSVYFVYLDEYENLLEPQKRIINSWVKHSEDPLIFNLAMKRNAFTTRETLGSESLTLDHDFREHDLEQYLFDNNDFDIFAAEILIHNLANIKKLKLPIDVEILKSPDQLNRRRENDYKRSINEFVKNIFPGLSTNEQAQLVFKNTALKNKLRDRVIKALKHNKSDIDPEKFISSIYPEASIIVPNLLYRNSNKPEEILKEIEKLKKGEENRFTGATDWIHNNFIAALLQLYEPQSRTCPFYAGFDTFCKLANGNIRHFLELCHKSMIRASLQNLEIGTSIPPEEQAEAARQTSASFLNEIKTFGPDGIKLYTFVLRLGNIFQLAHKRREISEPEPTHFAITGGSSPLNSEEHRFIMESTKWSVLFEEKSTKQKSDLKDQYNEYVLNPIYAPYFHISYRKKRKLMFTTDDINIIVRGSQNEFEFFVNKLSKKWKIDGDNDDPNLFSTID